MTASRPPEGECPFRFAPELFEYKNQAMQALADAGCMWMTHFGSIDVVHDLYGLEVEGIPDRDTAKQIGEVLKKIFRAPDFPQGPWKEGRRYQEYDGWIVEINKYPHPKLRSWLTPDETDE